MDLPRFDTQDDLVRALLARDFLYQDPASFRSGVLEAVRLLGGTLESETSISVGA